jgi:hypothetical protein
MNARKSKTMRRDAETLTKGFPNVHYRNHPKKGYIELSPGCTRKLYKAIKAGRIPEQFKAAYNNLQKTKAQQENASSF